MLFGLLSLVCCLALSVEGVGGAASMPAGVQPALERFLARPDEPITQYRARRTLEGHNPRFKMDGAIEAITELSANGRFSYTIVSETGSDYIREKVRRRFLETDAKVRSSGG